MSICRQCSRTPAGFRRPLGRVRFEQAVVISLVSQSSRSCCSTYPLKLRMAAPLPLLARQPSKGPWPEARKRPRTGHSNATEPGPPARHKQAKVASLGLGNAGLLPFHWHRMPACWLLSPAQTGQRAQSHGSGRCKSNPPPLTISPIAVRSGRQSVHVIVPHRPD
ncbi:hypothetical protein LX36DRAFT_30613 [Colletotrichum falcatum]|nr:hypothetical protein LX36DRAFT_30613 [Colletotrichum falcatum]